MEGLEPEPGVSQGFSSAQRSTPLYWVPRWVPSFWSKSLESQVLTGYVPSKCVLSPLPVLEIFPRRGAVLEQGSLKWVLCVGPVCPGVVPEPVRNPDCSQTSPNHECQEQLLSLHSDVMLGPIWLCAHSPQPWQPLLSVELHRGARGTRAGG